MSDQAPDQIDLSSLALAQVLHELSASIVWLGKLREDGTLHRDTRLQAIELQARLADAYRALLDAIETERRIEATERRQGALRGEVLALRDRLQGEEP